MGGRVGFFSFFFSSFLNTVYFLFHLLSFSADWAL